MEFTLKNFCIVLLESESLRALIIDPASVAVRVSSILNPHTLGRTPLFYKYQYSGFYDGVLTGLLRVSDTNGHRDRYIKPTSWSKFVNQMSSIGVSKYLGLNASFPRFGGKSSFDLDEPPLDSFALARNVALIGNIYQDEEVLADISFIFHSSENYFSRPSEIPRNSIGNRKWIDLVSDYLQGYKDLCAVGVTLLMGSKPYISTAPPPFFVAPG